jgi:alpha-beta hydrolase superfamily lysophospholipase
MVRHDEGEVVRGKTNGPRLYFNATSGQDPPRAVVALVHGYADYGARYAHVADAWTERGIASVAIDLRGHGRAGGRRGYCERFTDYLDDFAELEMLVEKRAPGVPRFLFGHSFGGLIAAAVAIANPAPWRALALSAPYFGLALDVPPAKVFAGKLVSRVIPMLGLPSGLKGADMTHDTARARAYDADPLIFKNATARWFTEAQAAQARTLERAPSLTMPLYLVMGTEDRVAKMASARAFFDAAGSADKTWNARPGLFHEVLNEPEGPAIADGIASFVLGHV